MCHRTHRSSSYYCVTGVQNSQKFRVRYIKVVSAPRVLWHSRTYLTKDPGTGMNVIHNLQKFRVRVRKCYRTRRSSGYCGTGVRNSQKLGRYENAVPVPRVLWHGLTELTEVLCRVTSGQKPRVWFWMYPTEYNIVKKFGFDCRIYKTYRSSWYG